MPNTNLHTHQDWDSCSCERAIKPESLMQGANLAITLNAKLVRDHTFQSVFAVGGTHHPGSNHGHVEAPPELTIENVLLVSEHVEKRYQLHTEEAGGPVLQGPSGQDAGWGLSPAGTIAVSLGPGVLHHGRGPTWLPCALASHGPNLHPRCPPPPTPEGTGMHCPLPSSVERRKG